MGGIGLLSFAECAPLARAAVIASADALLSNLIPSLDRPPPTPVQRDLCIEAFVTRKDAFLRRIQPIQRLWIEETHPA